MEEGILLFAHSTRRITTNDDGVKIKNEVPSKSWQERFAPRKLKGRLSRKLAVSGERILEEAKQVHPTPADIMIIRRRGKRRRGHKTRSVRERKKRIVKTLNR